MKEMIETSGEDARERVAAQPLWYHTLEVAPGVVTPGWFDLRPIVDRLPWPEVEGRRCLDVGPWDGFFAFELERRGAAEVVAADIGEHTEWDWSARMRAKGSAKLAEMAGPEVGAGFRLASELLGSSVERVEINVYELTPERVGTFDVVVCGTLMLHLRDPVRALEAIRGVCGGRFLSMEQIEADLSLRHRRRALGDFKAGERSQWWVPNAAGHRSLVHAAGFEIERTVRPYAIPLGPSHPAGRRPGSVRQRLATRILAGGVGVPHSALLARPDV
jgi:tRNA (mo5U34)-methyltransferase